MQVAAYGLIFALPISIIIFTFLVLSTDNNHRAVETYRQANMTGHCSSEQEVRFPGNMVIPPLGSEVGREVSGESY